MPHTFQLPLTKLDEAGLLRRIGLYGLALVLMIVLVMPRLTSGQTVVAIPEIRSGIAGYCLDDVKNSAKPAAVVDSRRCDGSTAEAWTIRGQTIRHAGIDCLALENTQGPDTAGQAVVLNPCDGSDGQTWVLDLGGYQNPASGLCLNVPKDKTDVQLDAYSCNDLSSPNESWTPATWDQASASTSASDCNKGSQGQRVACYAQQQWVAWQTEPSLHGALLADYTDGNAYEEWCADFVSYVYREAGYPFTGGERDGWDEYDANNIQNMGFTLHQAGSYVPQAGDVAFFDYPGGHVEVVVSGGAHPTFVYGDSGTTDPRTNNGDMAENSRTTDGDAGQVTYYLSPN